MIKKALIAAAAFSALSAHAGYAQLAPPAGFSTSNGAFSYAAAANDRVFGRVIHQAGALTANVGGQAVKMPAAYRLAANAPRVAAAVIYLHPGVRTAAGIAAWLGASALVYNATKGLWELPQADAQQSTGVLYRTAGRKTWYTTRQAACQAAHVLSYSADTYMRSPGAVYETDPLCKWYIMYKSNSGATPIKSYFETYYETKSDSCPAGTYSTPAGCSPVPPPRVLTQEEFENEITKNPMPSTVPKELPYPSPLPVEQPWINPSPGENPQSQPYRVPTGTPVPIPNTDPQQYRQPYVDIVPAPTPDNPWRVDVKPGETISTNPNPAENPQPDAEDKPAEEEDKSLCEKHPEIAACEKVEVTDKPLPDQPKLYEPKYPDGITGLWNSKLQEIKATPLFNLAPSLLPNVSTGSCPSWKVDLSIEGWTNAGLQDVSPPCWVWDVAKLVIIASALLLARRLIFGG